MLSTFRPTTLFLTALAVAVFDARTSSGYADPLQTASGVQCLFAFSPTPVLSPTLSGSHKVKCSSYPGLRAKRAATSLRFTSRSYRHSALQVRCSKTPQQSCASAETLRNFLMQRTIQTRMWYLTAVRNEVMTVWLADFLDHGHLDVKRVSDYESKARYHGTDGLMCSWSKYLRAMLATEKKTITVEYRVGTADISYWPDQGEVCNEEYKKVWGEDPPWAAAAASRRANPYLQDERNSLNNIAYDEVIDPRAEAQQLVTIREQLAKECMLDLKLVERENERLLLSYQQKDVLKTRAKNSTWHQPALLPTFRGEGQSVDPTSEDKSAVFESSPFRQMTWDLLLRLMTKISALDVLDELYLAGAESEAQYRWLKSMLAEALPRFEGSGPIQVDSAFLKDLLRRPPSFSIPDDGGSPQLVDPHRLAEMILERRARLASEWALLLAAIPADHRSILHPDQAH